MKPVISQRIKIERNRLNLTQKDLGDKIGVAKTTISGYEIGTSEPDLEVLKKMANIFEVSTDYLIGTSDIRDVTLKVKEEPAKYEEFPDDVRMLAREAKTLTLNQRSILANIIKDFKNAHK